MDNYINLVGRLIGIIISLTGSAVIFAVVFLGFEPSPKIVAVLAGGAASMGGLARSMIK